MVNDESKKYHRILGLHLAHDVRATGYPLEYGYIARVLAYIRYYNHIIPVKSIKRSIKK